MDAQPPTDYKKIKVTGPITVERKEKLRYSPVIRELVLILGPTGAGKSTFIEALANDSALGISSNQLDGFTQSVSAYQLHNVSLFGSEICLIDVPGFADTKVSAMSIVSMLKEWMQKNKIQNFDQFLYLIPINIARLPGSQREVLRIFRALTGIETARNITIVTTMWDSIWSNSGRERAERNFMQLQNNILKDEHERGSRIVKFTNTQHSALSVLDEAMEYSARRLFNVERFIRDEDLQTRVSGLKLHRYNIQMEAQEVSDSSNEELMAILRLQLDDVDTLLIKFEQELRDFGPPPISLEPAASRSESVPLAVSDVFSSGWPGFFSPPPIAPDPAQYQSESAPTALQTHPWMTTPVPSSVVRVPHDADRPIHAAAPTKRVFTRLFHGLKHLGKKTE